jgi:hypothetical protein
MIPASLYSEATRYLRNLTILYQVKVLDLQTVTVKL